MRLYKLIILAAASLGTAAAVAASGRGQLSHELFDHSVLTAEWFTAGGQNPDTILPQTPFTYLLDTGKAFTAALSGKDLAKKTGWFIVPEDNVTHQFKGDAVLLNDKLIVVLRRNSCGAEVYTKTADSFKPRALLTGCAGRANNAVSLSSVRIIENNPAAVTLEAAYQTQQRKILSLVYRLTTGQIYLEISGGKNTDSLSIQVHSSYVIVPDLFGDDLVFTAAAFHGWPVVLPTENFFLHMIEGNDAIVMCVWQGDKQDAEVIFCGQDRQSIISRSEIQFMKDKPIWVAFLQSPNIWYERTILDADRGKDIVLDWQRPFPAKWRADLTKEDELSESCNFKDKNELQFAHLTGAEATCSCWFDGGLAYIRTGKLKGPKGVDSSRLRFSNQVLVYPIDRNRATPLMVFSPVDILRNTLGVGPCQYILEKEGLASESNPTAEQVTRWVEKQFQRSKQKQTSNQIKERLKQMTEHISQTQMRIKQYGEFARRLRELIKKEKTSPGQVATVAGHKLLAIINDLEQNIVIRSDSMSPAESVARLADKITALITKDDVLANCQNLCRQIRAIGAAQDKALSRARMAARRIKQQSMMMAAKEPQAADLAQKLQQMAEQMLQKEG